MAEKFKYSENQISDLLDGIYAGQITEMNIPHDLYFAIADYLKSGVYKGFGGDLTKFTGKDLDLLNDLRENTYLFSGGKAYHQIKEYRNLLLDENGELRSKKEFTQLAHQEFSTWNDAWGLSERQTAIGQAQMASKWMNVEANADLLPILVFDTAGHPCEICDPYNGFAAHVSDPVWSWLTPLLHFNCECTVRQEEKDYPLATKGEYSKITGMKDTVSPEFRMNPGKDRVVFNSDHPYFQVDKDHLQFAKKNFGLPIPTLEEEIKTLKK